MEIDPKELVKLYDWLIKHTVDARAIAERIMVAEKALEHIQLRTHDVHAHRVASDALLRIEELKKL